MLDGATDLAVGRRYYLTPGESGAWLTYGPFAGAYDLADAPVQFKRDPADTSAADSSLGYALGPAGDADGDGRVDFLLTDPGCVGWSGATWLYSGDPGL